MATWLLVTIFSAAICVQLSLAQSPSCASVLCMTNTNCYEVMDSITGVVSPQCLHNSAVSVTEGVCQSGLPLLVSTAGENPVQANCGRTVNRVTCPSGYECNVAPDDTYAVCCISKGVTVKPGNCPAIEPGTFGICIVNCNSDEDCSGDEKCCKNPCGGLVCQPPAPAVPTGPSCLTVKCRANYECKESKSGPKCVPITKEGKCPSISYSNEIKPARCPPNCKSDADCPDVQKCCPQSGCSLTCQNPAGPSCKGKKCPRGQKCILQEVQCIRAPCYPIPQCVPID